MQKSGIVLSVNGKVAIVLTRDGEFCEVPCTPNVAIGSEIEWDTAALTRFSKRMTIPRFFVRWRNFAISGAAAAIAIAAGLWYYGAQNAYAATPYAYVSVEINPDISLVINKKMHVIEANALNPDGNALLGMLHLTGKPLKDALREIINASVEQHMLPEADNIIVTAAPAQENTDVSAVQEQVKKDITEAVVENAKAKELAPKVYSVRVSKTVWKAASGAHISPAQLAAYLIAKKHHIPLSADDTQGDVTRRVLVAAPDDDSATTDDVKQVQNAIRALPQVVKKLTPVPHALNITKPVSKPKSTDRQEKDHVHGGEGSDAKSKDAKHQGKAKHLVDASAGSPVNVSISSYESFVDPRSNGVSSSKSDSGKGHGNGKNKENDKEKEHSGSQQSAGRHGSQDKGGNRGDDEGEAKGRSDYRSSGPAPVNAVFNNAMGGGALTLPGNFSLPTSPSETFPSGSASASNVDSHKSSKDGGKAKVDGKKPDGDGKKANGNEKKDNGDGKKENGNEGKENGSGKKANGDGEKTNDKSGRKGSLDHQAGKGEHRKEHHQQDR